jgi:hypothetical protein
MDDIMIASPGFIERTPDAISVRRFGEIHARSDRFRSNCL